MARKTALNKEPKVDAEAVKAARRTYVTNVRKLESLEKGTPEYNQAVRQVRQTGQRLGYNTSRINTAIKKYTDLQGPNQEKRIERGLGGVVEKGIEQAEQFDPMTFYQQYQPAFEEGRQREYERIYGAFERQSAEQFGREQQQLEQSLVERGLDPSGEAYKSLKENLYKSQEAARQNARDAAMSNANALQQQYYLQASGSALLPSQIQQPYLNIYSEQGQREWAARQAELERQSREKLARSAGGGGGNTANQQWANFVMSQYGGQQQQPSTLNTGIQSLGQGAATAIIGNMNR